ncbi:MAG: crossover junction endodeoxyribonuclease RuvC [Candidatus Omnitrophica bacterium]|nr:crossover junction endodeoxyribonuclease RuvC [Candidatus Omnitrophota bacterium]
MKILGIDPGLQRTGYGIIDANGPESMKLIEAGIIKTSAEDGISKRVTDIYENLTDIIKENKPDVLVLEKLYAHYKHPATSILMGHARGVICLACGSNNVRLINYSATRIKKAVTGNGRAGKGQVQGMVRSLLGLKKDPDPVDISDALAMAISYVYIEGTGDKRGVK